MNDTELNTTNELSDSLGVEVDVTGEIAPVFDEAHARRVIEAVLFAAGHPITYAKLAEVLSTTPAKIRSVVDDYAEEYNSEASGLERGIMLLRFDDSCQLATCEAYGDHIRTALGIKRGGNLSPSSLEVLAIIAYNEPVTRAHVDTVRGVDSSYAVSSLVDKQLIESCGRLDAPGRPMLYRTTENFLRVFGLNSLADLPAVKTAEPPSPGQTIQIEIPEVSEKKTILAKDEDTALGDPPEASPDESTGEDEIGAEIDGAISTESL